MSELTDLPDGWSLTELKELLLNIQYGYTSPASEEPIGPRYLRITDLQNNAVDWKNVPFCQCDQIDKYGLKKGDIVIARTGATTGKSFLLKELPEAAVFASYLIRLHTSNAFPPEYLSWFMQSFDYWQQITEVSKGTAQPGANATILSKLIVPLPPLNEQRRIVSTIEQLTDRSNKARTALADVPKLIEQFRQSVLAAAFRGDLTADWREKNPVANREWHRDLLDSVRSSLKSTKRQGRLWGSGTFAKEIDDTWEQIPETWNWVKVVDLGYDPDEVVQIGPMSMKSNEFTNTGTIVLNVGCVQWTGINLAKCNFLPPDRAKDFERYRVKSNDILFTRSGEVGRAAIVPPDIDSVLMTFHLLRVRTAHEICIPEYLYLLFQGSKSVRTQIENSIIGATRAGFNTKLLQNIFIPLPPVSEQIKILSQIDKQLSVITHLKSELTEFTDQLVQLDRSILAKAFRGELVPQDPNDETAAVLLERIRAEREQTSTSKQRGKTTRKNSSKQLSINGIE